MKFDVIVTGAGPAGCAAAYDLALTGRRVMLLDSRRFPRVKPCAGGITVKTIKRLRYRIDPVVRHVCNEVRLGRGLETTAQFRSTRPLCSMTVRSEFDEFCLEQTIGRGAVFQAATTMRHVNETEHGVSVDTTGGEFHARYLIGADGVNSVVRRSLTGGKTDRPLAFAIEAQVRSDHLPPMTFDFGVIKSGYGWLFPKDDHVNVGLYSRSAHELPGREHLVDYARAKLGRLPLECVVGHYIGVGDGRNPSGSARIILAGDAANFGEPLLGEGIHNAVVSGQIAAAAVVDADAMREPLSLMYTRGLRALRAELRITRTLADKFYQHLDLGYRLTRLLSQLGLLRAYASGLTLTAGTAMSYAE